MAFQAKAEPISSDIVGYATADLGKDGFTGASACFVPVSSSTYNLQDLKVVGYDRADAEFAGFEGDVYLETLNGLGRMEASYSWVDVPKDPDDADSVAYYGWYDGEDYITNEVFKPGDGFWVYSDSTDWTIQSAGKVPTTGVAASLRKDGFKMISNPMPVSVNLNDDDNDGNWVVVGGYDHNASNFEGFEGDVYLETLDGLGRMLKVYSWVDVPKDPDDEDSVAYYGWYDGEALIENASFKPGEGVWVYSDSADWTIEFPGVSL